MMQLARESAETGSTKIDQDDLRKMLLAGSMKASAEQYERTHLSGAPAVLHFDATNDAIKTSFPRLLGLSYTRAETISTDTLEGDVYRYDINLRETLLRYKRSKQLSVEKLCETIRDKWKEMQGWMTSRVKEANTECDNLQVAFEKADPGAVTFAEHRAREARAKKADLVKLSEELKNSSPPDLEKLEQCMSGKIAFDAGILETLRFLESHQNDSDQQILNTDDVVPTTIAIKCAADKPGLGGLEGSKVFLRMEAKAYKHIQKEEPQEKSKKYAYAEFFGGCAPPENEADIVSTNDYHGLPMVALRYYEEGDLGAFMKRHVSCAFDQCTALSVLKILNGILKSTMRGEALSVMKHNLFEADRSSGLPEKLQHINGDIKPQNMVIRSASGTEDSHGFDVRLIDPRKIWRTKKKGDAELKDYPIPLCTPCYMIPTAWLQAKPGIKIGGPSDKIRDVWAIFMTMCELVAQACVPDTMDVQNPLLTLAASVTAEIERHRGEAHWEGRLMQRAKLMRHSAEVNETFALAQDRFVSSCTACMEIPVPAEKSLDIQKYYKGEDVPPENAKYPEYFEWVRQRGMQCILCSLHTLQVWLAAQQDSNAGDVRNSRNAQFEVLGKALCKILRIGTWCNKVVGDTDSKETEMHFKQFKTLCSDEKEAFNAQSDLNDSWLECAERIMREADEELTMFHKLILPYTNFFDGKWNNFKNSIERCKQLQKATNASQQFKNEITGNGWRKMLKNAVQGGIEKLPGGTASLAAFSTAALSTAMYTFGPSSFAAAVVAYLAASGAYMTTPKTAKKQVDKLVNTAKIAAEEEAVKAAKDAAAKAAKLTMNENEEKAAQSLKDDMNAISEWVDKNSNADDKAIKLQCMIWNSCLKDLVFEKKSIESELGQLIDAELKRMEEEYKRRATALYMHKHLGEPLPQDFQDDKRVKMVGRADFAPADPSATRSQLLQTGGA